MKKFKNKWLRIAGIVLSMTGIALLARPLISALFGKKISILVFGLVQWIHGCYCLGCFPYYRASDHLHNGTS